MILKPPFLISARLLPALKINDSFLSWDGANFYLDTPDGEHIIDDFHPGASAGTQECFRAILSFMTAANEAYQYQLKHGTPSDNANLFTPAVTNWIVDNHNAIDMRSSEIEDRDNLIEE